MGKKNLDYVCVPRDEYDELIECKLHINALYDFITKEHEHSIKTFGYKCSTMDVKAIELACGYYDNENYFNNLKREYKERMAKK